MKLTFFILALPVALIIALLNVKHTNGELLNVLGLAYVLASALCFVWGFYISRKNRALGWLCVAVGVVPLLLILLPVYSHG